MPAAASTLVSGVAAGALDLQNSANALGESGAPGLASGGSGMFAALAGAGFIVLLALRRQTLTTRAMPVSPVYATDSSPD